jgi:3-hydroxybutyryl-CoA dehydratase
VTSPFAAVVGVRCGYRRIVSSADILAFAELSGDHSPNHVDAAFMATTPYGRCIAHGALLVAFMSRCSTDVVPLCGALHDRHFPVSLGYDRVRFLAAVGAGDVIALDYVITSADAGKARTMAQVEVRNEQGVLCAVATHIMVWQAKA